MELKVNVKRDNRRAIVGAVRAAANQAVVEVAEDVLAEINSRGLVPYEEGTLERSGEVVPVPSRVAAAITYDTPYARKQHEDRSLHHPRQGEDHWLERTLEGNADRYFEHIAASIRKKTSG